MNRNGNALFLILIAVALFAALSYAVTQSSRGGGNIDREQATLTSSQIANYTALAQNTISRIRLLYSINYFDTCFHHANRSNNDFNQYPSRCSSEPENQFFEYLDWQDVPESSLDSSFSSETHYGQYEFSNKDVIGIGQDCDQTDCSELIIYARWVTDEVCTAYNDQVGVTNPSGNPPVFDYSQYVALQPFACNADGTGSWCFSGDTANAIGGVRSPGLAGEETACFSARHYHNGGPIGNVVYSVLEAQ